MRLIVVVLFVLFSFSAQATPTHVAKPTVVIKKVKLLRSNPHRYAAIRFAGTDPTTEVDDEDIIPQRRHRSRLEHEIEPDLSDHVRTRLLIARTRALKKFAQAHGTLV
jgi:hypothetical protein